MAVSDAPSGRVSSGNANLDSILNGGFVARRPYLVVGPLGTGKTKLALQFLCEGVRQGEKVLLVTLEQPPNELRLDNPALFPELDAVYVFDAISDVMRYQHTPHVDISEARLSIPFSEVTNEMRKSPDLTSVEVAFSSLEQTLKNEFARRSFTRVVIDSLTAMEYFNMKGFDPMVGAQTFLRLLSDLGTTALLTVEAPTEEAETVERLLARGSIRLFRWDLDGQTQRAVGIEKFRGSATDIRLHPYKVSAQGLEIDLGATASREAPAPASSATRRGPESASLAPAVEIVRAVTEINYLTALGGDAAPAQVELELAREANRADRSEQVQVHIGRAREFVDQRLAEVRSTRGVPSRVPRAATPDAPSTPRVSMGIQGIDRMLDGGLVPGRPYLVTGGPGTGKTLLGLAFLAEGLRRGENVLLVAVDEPPAEIRENVRSIGWDLSKVQVLDANPGTRLTRGMSDVHEGRVLSDLQPLGEISDESRRAIEGGEVSLQAIHSKLSQGMASMRFTRVLVDSITSIRRLAVRSEADLQARRTEVQSLLRFLSEQGATTVVTTMAGNPEVLTPEEVLTRGELLLTRKWVDDRSIRFIRAVRMRGSSHLMEARPFAITSEGIFCE
jgi:KaiC/GvpD/RAD55 family RecA-like ATPase